MALVPMLGAAAGAETIHEFQKLLASGVAGGDYFGRQVSIDGDTAVVAAARDDSYAGSAYIYSDDGSGTWSQVTKLVASDRALYDVFGVGVSISGDRVIVGANSEGGSGSAYVFTNVGGTWTETAKLRPSDAAASDMFGTSVSISGDTAIVGAYWDDDHGSCSGSAYIFDYSGGTWSQTAKLTASDAEERDSFGRAVAISGNNAIVGAFQEDDPGSNSGAAYIFTDNGGTWGETAKLTASDAGGGHEFGLSVDISGDTAVVGAYKNHQLPQYYTGSAYIFDNNGGAWTQTAKLTASDAAGNDEFGYSVAIDGETVMVGAHGDDSDAGSAYVFVRESGTWTETVKLVASDAAPYDLFGEGVSISGDMAITGAFANDDLGAETGSAYLYALPEFSILPAGSDISGEVGGGSDTIGGIDFTFDQIVEPGGVFSSQFSEVPLAELGDLVGSGEINFLLPTEPVQVWDLAFDGSFEGSAELVFGYDESTLFVPEASLTIIHYEEGVGWLPLDVIERNLDENWIRVTTDSFSPFMLGTVPEPSTFVLLGMGAVGLLVFRRRKWRH